MTSKGSGAFQAATVAASTLREKLPELRIEVIDNFGRSVSGDDVDAAREVAHASGFAESLHIYNYLNVQLLNGDGDDVDGGDFVTTFAVADAGVELLQVRQRDLALPLEDGLDVVTDGVGGDAEFRCDLFVPLAVSSQQHDLRSHP